MYCANTAEFRLHECLPEFEHESDSQVGKYFRTSSAFKNFGTGEESKSQTLTPATSAIE